MPGLAPDPGLDEADLVSRLRSGDEEAFTWLVTAWTPALIRTAARFVPTRETAEEVVQDTWLAVVDGLDGFSGRSALRTWVVAILIHKAQRVGGREHRSMPFSSAGQKERQPAVAPDRFPRGGDDAGTWLFPVASWAVDPDASAQHAELHLVLDRSIATLPRLQQQVATARNIWGRDADEVCQLLHITANDPCPSRGGRVAPARLRGLRRLCRPDAHDDRSGGLHRDHRRATRGRPACGHARRPALRVPRPGHFVAPAMNSLRDRL